MVHAMETPDSRKSRVLGQPGLHGWMDGCLLGWMDGWMEILYELSQLLNNLNGTLLNETSQTKELHTTIYSCRYITF